jgi:uncharacterized protein (DUF1015 family)
MLENIPMTEVRGFRGIRFQDAKVDSFDAVVTPPFDVISPEERAELMARSPHNMVRLLLPEERDGKTKYEAAGEDLEQWLSESVLAQDDEESFYLLEQHFTGLDGLDHVRRGFFAVAKLPEHDENFVLGHERTFHYKVEDRLALTEATEANLGGVFVLYDDPGNALQNFFATMDTREPDILAHTIDGVDQRIWRVPQDDAVTDFFKGQTLYIADGHHRFRTAWTYRDAMREKHGTSSGQRYDYIFLGFVPLQDPGLFVYPAHRVLDSPEGFDLPAFLKALDPWFEVEEASGDLAALINEEANCAFGLCTANGGDYLLRLRDIDRKDLLGDEHGPAWRDLDVSVLHGGILERVLGLPSGAEFVYEKDPAKAAAMVREGQKGLAFIQRNMAPQQICACADAVEFMPQKATYFFPKLPSGAVFHRLK